MKVDLVIRGGTIADGTGAELREADIAVRDGRIVEVGKVAASGVEEVDAKGLLVTPGFIDPHTHYDGQLTWSDKLDPSSGHGVTTVVVGNCGVGFAPCKPEDREALVRLMEGVEDIPEIVMAEGLPWDWESFPDYLDAVEARPHDIDFTVLLPHAAMRVATMGERAARLEPSTEADRAAMRAIATEAMRAGAGGFSTSRSIFHKASDGSAVPTLTAEDEELREIALGMKDAGRGVIQAIIMNQGMQTDEFERLHDIAAESGRPLSYTMVQVPWDKDLWRRVGKTVEARNAAGTEVRMQVFNRPVGMILGLDTTFNPFSMNPFYAEHIAPLPPAEQAARMRDPEVRAKLLTPGNAIDHPLAFNLTRFEQMYPMGEYADYEPDPATGIAAQAAARGVDPLEVVYEALLARDGQGKILVAATNFDDGHLDTTLELMQHEHAVIALGDGGAHYGLVCDSSYSTFMLSHWARDRQREGRLSIPEAVRMMTDAPARMQRFHDRGRIAPGLRADLNIIDLDRLRLFSPHVIHDLPAGGRRITQDAEGYVATYVAGTAIRRDGRDTGARPGKLIRDAGC
jgi:N-acyl-D-amino-acid deacylase